MRLVLTVMSLHQQAIPVYPCVGIGDISFISNDEKLPDSFEGWTSNSYPDMAPRSFDDVLSGDIMEWLSVYAYLLHLLSQDQ